MISALLGETEFGRVADLAVDLGEVVEAVADDQGLERAVFVRNNVVVRPAAHKFRAEHRLSGRFRRRGFSGRRRRRVGVGSRCSWRLFRRRVERRLCGRRCGGRGVVGRCVVSAAAAAGRKRHEKRTNQEISTHAERLVMPLFQGSVEIGVARHTPRAVGAVPDRSVRPVRRHGARCLRITLR